MSSTPYDPLLVRLDRLADLLERSLSGSPGERFPQGLGPGRAFTWQANGLLRPARRPARVDPDVLVGIERQKSLFYENISRFARGVPSHDVLLWGERGTGKSSLARSLLTAFPDSELALLAITEPCIPKLPGLLDALQADPRKWVLFFDDLSFTRPDEDYKEFKILLEGGLEDRPANTLAVATSNRRHLLPETFREDRDIHPEESVAETISLSDRFGLSLGFYPFHQDQFLEAVRRHLQALGCDALPFQWESRARQWAMGRGIRSGRSALQAARDIAGDLLSGSA